VCCLTIQEKFRVSKESKFFDFWDNFFTTNPMSNHSVQKNANVHNFLNRKRMYIPQLKNWFSIQNFVQLFWWGFRRGFVSRNYIYLVRVRDINFRKLFKSVKFILRYRCAQVPRGTRKGCMPPKPIPFLYPLRWHFAILAQKPRKNFVRFARNL